MITLNKDRSEAVNVDNLSPDEIALSVRNLNLYYGQAQALSNINMDIPKGKVTAFIGPSGCGKSTLLRCINRMNDLVETCRIDGEINLHGQNIYDRKVDVAALRRQVGMVFSTAKPVPEVDLRKCGLWFALDGRK